MICGIYNPNYKNVTFLRPTWPLRRPQRIQFGECLHITVNFNKNTDIIRIIWIETL